jgi:hypothetical protein
MMMSEKGMRMGAWLEQKGELRGRLADLEGRTRSASGGHLTRSCACHGFCPDRDSAMLRISSLFDEQPNHFALCWTTSVS